MSVSFAGDFNGDGYSDIIIGAYYADPNSLTSAGTSYVIFGYNSTSTSSTDIDLASDIASSDLGFKVCTKIMFQNVNYLL